MIFPAEKPPWLVPVFSSQARLITKRIVSFIITRSPFIHHLPWFSSVYRCHQTWRAGKYTITSLFGDFPKAPFPSWISSHMDPQLPSLQGRASGSGSIALRRAFLACGSFGHPAFRRLALDFRRFHHDFIVVNRAYYCVVNMWFICG